MAPRMNPNFGGGFQPQASISDGWEHPDLQDDLPSDPDERLNQQAKDPEWRDQHRRELEREFQQLPPDVASELAGRPYAGSYAEGYAEYQRDIRRTLKDKRIILDSDIDSMSMKEYDKYFNDDGTPKEGYRVHYARAVDLNKLQASAFRDASTASEYAQAQRAERARQPAPPPAPPERSEVIDRTKGPGHPWYR